MVVAQEKFLINQSILIIYCCTYLIFMHTHIKDPSLTNWSWKDHMKKVPIFCFIQNPF
jgi:hypothetical protein